MARLGVPLPLQRASESFSENALRRIFPEGFVNSEMTYGFPCFMADLAGQHPNRLSGKITPWIRMGKWRRGRDSNRRALTTQLVR